VTELVPLRGAEAFDAMVEASVRAWRFSPASRDGVPIPSAVFVGVVVRPPEMYLLGGQDGGAVSSSRSPGAPRPVTAMMPPYPPNARGGAIVILQTTIGASGDVEAADVIQSGGAAFDEAARATARQWRFTPATTPAYLVFVFREPVVVTTAPRR
jgi:TonB family protein